MSARRVGLPLEELDREVDQVGVELPAGTPVELLDRTCTSTLDRTSGLPHLASPRPGTAIVRRARRLYDDAGA
jgi:hypothetical protein